MVVIMTIVGFGVGFVCACIGVLRLKIGVLQIDRSDPSDPPYPFLVIQKHTSIEEISRRNYVLLEVRNENFISQE